MLKPTVTWVLVADAERARMLVDDGQDEGLRQLPGASLRADPKDKPSDDEGRTMSRVTGARPRLDRHVENAPETEAFARTIVRTLDEARREGRFDRLVLCAAPAMLGLIRRTMEVEPKGPSLRESVRGEIAKDLVKVPTDDLPSHLAGFLKIRA